MSYFPLADEGGQQPILVMEGPGEVEPADDPDQGRHDKSNATADGDATNDDSDGDSVPNYLDIDDDGDGDD